ncbi:MAG: hypothetical protein ACI4N3_04645 [Alphaproteobacteria bacterium]
MKIDTKTNYSKNMNIDFVEAIKVVKEKIAPQVPPYEMTDNKVEVRRNGNLFFANYNGFKMSFGVKSR